MRKPAKIKLSNSGGLFGPDESGTDAEIGKVPWKPVPGREAAAAQWLQAERERFARETEIYATWRAATDARLKARATQGIAAQLRAMQVGESRAFPQYRHVAQTSSTIGYVSAVEGRKYKSGFDAALDCIVIRRVS